MMNNTPEELSNALRIIGEEIKGIRFAMLTMMEEDGLLVSRPLAVLEAEFDGGFWFFIEASVPDEDEVLRHQEANLSYVAPDGNRCVSISGAAQVIHDRQKMQQFWKPYLEAWFPKGLDDPNLALLKISVESATYWNVPSSRRVMRPGNHAETLPPGLQSQDVEHQRFDLY